MDLFNSKRVKKLEEALLVVEDKIKTLEKPLAVRVGEVKLEKIVYRCSFISTTTEERLPQKVSIQEAIVFLYKHFNLEVVKTEAISSKTTIKKKKKGSK